MVLWEGANKVLSSISKFITDTFFALLTFTFVVFVAGQLYAMHFISVRESNTMLFAPIILLVLVLFFKIVE